MKKLFFCFIALGLSTLGCSEGFAQGGDLPSGTIKIVVPFAPGGIVDGLARMVAQRMSENLKQPVVVENRPGGGGVVGALAVVQSPADGSVMMLGGTGHGINQALNPKMSYDLLKDLAAVSLVARGPNLMVIHPSVPARTVPEFVALLKANPGKYSFGSSGHGNSGHLFGELFKHVTGTDAVHVPYGGTGPMMNDLLAGRVQFTIDTLPVPMQHAKAGTLVALGVTTKERWPDLPEVPSISDSLPTLVGSNWQGLWAPAGTPPAVVERLSKEIAKVVQSPDINERIFAFGTRPTHSTPTEFTAFIRSEVDRWAELIKAAGLSPK